MPRKRRKPCAFCHREMQKPANYSHKQWQDRRFCSRECVRASSVRLTNERLEKDVKTCAVCGTRFSQLTIGRRASKQWEKQKCCSGGCARKLASQTYAKNHPPKPLQPKIARDRRTATFDDGTKICPRCSIRRPLDQFPIKGTLSNGQERYGYCKPCHNSYQRRNKLKVLFSLTEEDYQHIVDHQGNVCAICLRPPKDKRLAVDHDHKTGLIRGAVCWSCNKGLAYWNDDLLRLRRAAEYLFSPPAVEALGREVFGRPGKTTARRKGRKRERRNGE